MQVTRQLQAHVNLFSKTEFNSYFMQITCIFIVYYLLFLPTNAYIYILKYSIILKVLLLISVLLHRLQEALILRLIKL